jgi:hypothetical protein
LGGSLFLVGRTQPTQPTKKKSPPYVPFLADLVTWSQTEPRYHLDPVAILISIWRKAEVNKLDIFRYVYAEDDTHGSALHELATLWQAAQISAIDVAKMCTIIRQFVYVLGILQVGEPEFAGGRMSTPKEGKRVYARTMFNCIKPSLVEARTIMHPYLREVVTSARGPQAGVLFDNFSALKPSAMPLGTSKFIDQLNTKQLTQGRQAGNDYVPRCSRCKAKVPGGNFRKHNNICTGKSEEED